MTFRVDGKDIEVASRDELLVPTGGNRICVFQHGAFEVVDVDQVATLRRERAAIGD